MNPDNQQSEVNSAEQPPVDSQPTQPTSTQPSVASPGKTSFKDKFKQKKVKMAAIIFVVVLFLLGASAAAYFAVIVPNQPQNVIKKALSNALSKEKTSGKGSASFKGKEESAAVVVNYSLQTDTTKNATAGQVDVAVSGVKVPFEFRAVDKAAYIKVGDLTTVESLLAAYAGAGSEAFVKEITGKVSNKWIEFDESLLKTATSDECSLLSGQDKISQEQIDQMLAIYDKNMFITVKNTSKDTIDGKKTTKAELGLDKEKAKAFAKQLEQIDYVKKLVKCAGDEGTKSAESSADEFKGEVTVTVWVDGGKNLVKFAVKVVDEEGTLEADFTYNDDKVDIQKPEGAIPAMQIFGELAPMLGLGGALGTPAAGAATGGSASQAKTLECVQKLQTDPSSTPSAECATLLGL